MEFIKPSIENTDRIRRLLNNNEYRCCDFSAGTLILWGEYYGYVYTVIDEFFVIRMTEYKAFTFPMYVGEEKLNPEEQEKRCSEVLEGLMGYFTEHGEKPCFALLSYEQSEMLEKKYPGWFEFSDNADYKDYIYNTDDLAELRGRHYHGKRNHIYRFEENYPGYKAESITEENIRSCKVIAENWTDDTAEEILYEKDTIITALEHMEELGLEVYYNGDRALTEFKIKCYQAIKGYWQYIGLYTPDFLIIQRREGKIYKVIIVETKGEIYANDPKFRARRGFVEAEFIMQNNAAFGYERFEYLYLEDKMEEIDRLSSITHSISRFFEE